MKFKGNLSFDTITDPGKDLKEFLPGWEKFLVSSFTPFIVEMGIPKFKPAGLFPILKAGATTDETPVVNSSVHSLIRGARIICRLP